MVDQRASMGRGRVPGPALGASGASPAAEGVLEVGSSRGSNATASGMSSPVRAKFYEWVFFVLVTVMLIQGWRDRGEEYLTAESGLGYALGIIGGGMMLLLLLYPLRKRVRFMRNWGTVKSWFQIHMMLGILGPALVLFHCNFRASSLNSTVALVSMLVVAGSGIVGRYIYTKIHYGLYGRQMSLKEMKDRIEDQMNQIASVMAYAPKARDRLLAFDAAMLATRYSLIQSIWRFLIISFWTRWTHLRLYLSIKWALKGAAARERWSGSDLKRRRRAAMDVVSAHMAMAFKISEFSFFERVFALWHLFHFPLTIILILATAAHVIAVHLY